MTMRGIDTLAVARKLESAGVERVQAEAHAEALNEVVVIRYADLATKADFARLPTREDLEQFATREDLERATNREDLVEYLSLRFATKEDLERATNKEDWVDYLRLTFATKEDLKDYPTRDEMTAALARLEKRMMAMWAASTVSLAGLIIAMPFIAG